MYIIIFLNLLFLSQQIKDFSENIFNSFGYYASSFKLCVGVSQCSESEVFSVDLTAEETSVEPELWRKLSLGNPKETIDLYLKSSNVLLQNFKVITNENENRNILGLSFKFNDNKTSLVHQLYEKKFISNRLFGFYKEGSSFKMFLGSPPLSFSNYVMHSTKVVQKDTKWNIALSKIIVNDKVYQKNQIAYFRTNLQRILAPRKFILYLRDNLFAPYIKNHTCLFLDNDLFSRFECREVDEILNQNFEISFVINNKKFPLLKKDWFYHGVYDYVFLVGENKENDDWVLGGCFIEEYFPIFDYDNRELVFHSKVELENYNDGENYRRTCLKMTLLCMQIFGMLSCIFISMMYKRFRM